MTYSFSNIIKKIDSGITPVDEQHRLIDDSINKLANMMATRDEDIHNMMENIIKMYKDHFREEELLLCGVDGFEEHKKEHDMFLVQMDDIISPVRMVLLLKNWNEGHLLSRDIPDYNKLENTKK